MKEEYPSRILAQAVNELAKLPGVGQRTALRLALHLLRKAPEEGLYLAKSIEHLIEHIKFCKMCHNISDTDLCDICASPQRDHTTLCVVENIRNVMTIEKTGVYRGLYHVLGGVISPIEGIGPGQLQIESLITRLDDGIVQEVIFALNPTMEGDTTNYFISKKIQHKNIKLTTLARGISVGDDIEYADEMTLGRSIVNRVEFK